jgi:hypothetical protein
VRGRDVPTVVCCRRGKDEYVLLTHDLERIHAWGSRAEMLDADVPERALDLADRTGSAQLTDPPAVGRYPWPVTDIQEGDFFIDRARAAEYCASRADAVGPGVAGVADLALDSVSWAEDRVE